MDYVSVRFYLLLVAVLIIYYVLPIKHRWWALLLGSVVFIALQTRPPAVAVFIYVIVASYAMGILLYKSNIKQDEHKGKFLVISILLTLLPLLTVKCRPALLGVERLFDLKHGIIVPMGLSFFTMQVLAYLIDIYKGKIEPQRDFLKYALFLSFFPQILQGPIPRYDQLQHQLVEGHRFDETEFTKGFMLIIWGFFLKFMIADKAKIVTDTIFSSPDVYSGFFVLVGGILYNIRLYTDFLSCVTLAQGVSQLFGIRLAENFNHPYFATSIKDFWGRWHISLSFWLRDYVYFSLGGSRKGKLRKYINIVITFLVSGAWHGTGWNYIVWGLMHSFYQIFGELTKPFRDVFVERIGIPKDSSARKCIACACTFFLVMTTRIISGSRNLDQGLLMLKSMFTTYNPWIFFDDSLLRLGLVWKEWVVLLISIYILFCVSSRQELFCIRDRILEQPFCVRCALYVIAVICVMTFGTYGYGFNAADFIYRGF